MRNAKKKMLALNRNEVLQGPSPKVRTAIREFTIAEASLYFEGYHGSALKDVLAKKYHLPSERVSVGYGAEFFFRSIFDSLQEKIDCVLVADPFYGYYAHYARVRGIGLVSFPFIDTGSDFVFDIHRAIREMRRVKPRVIIVTSPNNPTGGTISPRDFGKLLSVADSKTLIVLDEAYWGFDAHYDEHAFRVLLEKHPNMVILRTFSKRYALAGLRIGFALWGSGAKNLIRFDDLYLGTSRLLDAAAIAALQSESYYKKLSKTIVVERERFRKAVNGLRHFHAYESRTNFIFVKVAPEAVSETKNRLDMLSVAVAKFVTPDGMRISVGSPKHMRDFLEVLRDIDRRVGRE